MSFLKQSTAHTFRLGPFVDSTDGDTEENALTIAAASVLLSKAGGALAAKNEATALTDTGANAHYTCILNTTDTNTLGTLRVWCHVAGALAVFKDFLVLPALVYDSLVAGSDALQVDTIQVGGTSQTANDASGDIDTILSRVVGTVASGTHNPQGGDAFARLGAPAGASVSADVAAVKTDTGNLVTRITATLFSGITSLAQWLGLIAGKQVGNATARTEIRATGAGAGTFDETTDSQEAIRDTAPLGTAMRGTDNAALASVCTEARLAELDAANLPTDVANVKTDTAAILVDTGTTLDAALAVVDANVDAILADTGTDGVVVATASKTGYALSAAGVQAIWDALTTALTTAGSIGKKLADWVIGSLNADQSAVTVGTVTALTNAPSDSSGVTTLLTRASEARLAELDAANLPADVAARATPAQVNAEVLDVLATDTFSEPGQEAPAATNTLAKKIGYLFKFLRNKVTQDATTLSVYADDGTTVDQKATVSDDATTYTRGEIGTGP